MLRTISTTLLLFASIRNLLAKDEAASSQEFLDGVARAAKLVDEKEASWRVEGSSGRVDVSDEKADHWSNLTESRFNEQCSINRGCASNTTVNRGGLETVYVINPHYAFQVNRTSQHESWTIEFIERIGASEMH